MYEIRGDNMSIQGPNENKQGWMEWAKAKFPSKSPSDDMCKPPIEFPKMENKKNPEMCNPPRINYLKLGMDKIGELFRGTKQ